MIASFRIIRWGLLLLVALMPFHAFLSIWAGDVFGAQMVFQAWKELVIGIITLLILIVVAKDSGVRAKLKQPLIYLIGAYMGLSFLITLIASPPILPALVGFKTNIAMLLVFIAAYLVSGLNFKLRLVKAFMISSAVVIGFGLLQAYLLPKDFLSSFGYGPDTLAPYFMVDPAINAVRILSTLGGPNQLGAFLILPISLAVALMFKKFSWWQPLFIASGSLVVWHTYSRSAWLGLGIAVGITILLNLPRRLRLPLLLLATIFAAIILNLLITSSTTSSRLQYYVFHHTIENVGLIGSTDQHRIATDNAFAKIQSHPWGEGLGTAGPASFYSSSPFIPESWYLQLGIEVGVLGMILFITIQIVLALQLWRVKDNIGIAPALIGALAGVGTVNFFLHGWADSSTALTFWTIAGASLGAGLYAKNSKKEAK